MRDWELRWCPACDHDHVRPRREPPRATELPCSQCGSEMITLDLLLMVPDQLAERVKRLVAA